MNHLIKLLLLVSFVFSSAYAADPVIPKVDDINNQAPQINKNLQKKEMPSDTLFEPKAKAPVEEGDLIKILVTEFNFSGNKKYPSSEFQKLVKNKNITDGKVIIYIAEGRIGKVEIKESAKTTLNVSRDRITGFVFNKINPNEILNIVQLDRNIRNLNNTPGINAIAELVEGEQLGETDIIISASNTK